jgi:hypothetical protein
MNYTSSVQNTSQSVYTPYIIKSSGNGNGGTVLLLYRMQRNRANNLTHDIALGLPRNDSSHPHGHNL